MAAVIVGLGVWWLLKSLADSWAPPDDHVAASDRRVCPQTSMNNDPLADATSHFELVLPRGATGVVFTATVGGLQGDSDLSLRFTTTAAGLASFLTASRISPPTPTTRVTDGDWTIFPSSSKPTGPCGLTPPVGPHMVYSQDQPDGPMGSSPRSVAVDMTDPAHPVVWVDALDI
ncbi:hypothetical protein [Streptacidiphilus fuscans]|uniref:Uncharacterized protein n=1 Tax=Streptacidiphilus fuscans TaxID=2789292 RepID=A0A931B8V6_9ACTN|nr:hypothetical protein [Streptacidiphilus fuscans]MBF9069015.1 hypothetical protein [Streptacidiphilus fuscans]